MMSWGGLAERVDHCKLHRCERVVDAPVAVEEVVVFRGGDGVGRQIRWRGLWRRRQLLGLLLLLRGGSGGGRGVTGEEAENGARPG